MSFAGLSPTLILTSMITAIFIITVRKFAQKLKIISSHGGRRIERRPIPLIGGIAICFSILCAAAFGHFSSDSLIVLGLSMPILFLGILDDTIELDARRKLPIEIICALAWVFHLDSNELILTQIGLPTLAAQLLTAFWIVGVTNAVNLSDGIDGLVAGLSAAVAAILIFACPTSVFVPLWAALIFSLAGFLPFNFYSRFKTFLGDGGSLWLGFILATTASVSKVTANPIWDACILMSLFCYSEFDTLFAIVRRLRASQPVMQGDHYHIHHQIRQLGFKPLSSSLIIVTVNASVALSFVFAALLNQPLVSILPCTLALLTFLVTIRASATSRLNMRKTGSELVLWKVDSPADNVIPLVQPSQVVETPILVASIHLDRMFDTIPLLSEKTVLEAAIVLKKISNQYTVRLEAGQMRIFTYQSQAAIAADSIAQQLRVGLKMQRADDTSIFTFASFSHSTNDSKQPPKAA